MTDPKKLPSNDKQENSPSLLDQVLQAPREPLPKGTTAEHVHAFLRVAMDKHRTGKLDEAERMYRQLLRWQADNSDALHLLGLLAAQLDQYEDALPLIERAIAIDPEVPEYHANYGNVLKIRSRLPDARTAFETALRLKPDFPEALMNLATVERALGRFAESEQRLKRALELRPDYADAEVNLANLYLARGRFDDATALYQKALKSEPHYVGAYESFARAACRAGRIDEAAAAFRHLLAFDPSNEVARHLLAACTSDPTCERASRDYVRRLFDDYAPHFDESLASLQYCAPRLIAERLTGLLPKMAAVAILDVGCGTGLCGPLLSPLADRMVGVDLSPGMLAEAKKRGVYDDLVEADLVAYMAEQRAAFDAIISADTLVYIGRLEEVVVAAAASLKPGGWLIFTLEQMAEDDASGNGYRLAPHGRFEHQPNYVEAALGEAGLATVSLDAVVPRLEGGRPVPGILVTARKPPLG